MNSPFQNGFCQFKDKPKSVNRPMILISGADLRIIGIAPPNKCFRGGDQHLNSVSEAKNAGIAGGCHFVE